jgi:hypothetical protein
MVYKNPLCLLPCSQMAVIGLYPRDAIKFMDHKGQYYCKPINCSSYVIYITLANASSIIAHKYTICFVLLANLWQTLVGFLPLKSRWNKTF